MLRRHIEKHTHDGESAWSVEVVMRGISRRSSAEAIGEAFEMRSTPWAQQNQSTSAPLVNDTDEDQPNDWLAWVPSVNPAVRVTDRGSAALLAIPIRRLWWTRAMRLREHRVWALDTRGTKLWRLIDGQRTMGQLIDAIAQSENLSHAQARGSVGAFVRELMRRGAVVILASSRNKGGDQ
jgi:hypothetical protein